MFSTIHSQIQTSPFKNVYWFARYLLNTGQFGALGKLKEKSAVGGVDDEEIFSHGGRIHLDFYKC